MRMCLRRFLLGLGTPRMHAVFSLQPVCVLRGHEVRARLVALCPSTPAFFAHVDAY